jgi:hypothetical protein
MDMNKIIAHDTNYRLGVLAMGLAAICLLSGCQTATSFETSVSLTSPPIENDPNVPAPKPVDPLDVLIALEKIAADSGLEPSTAGEDEASLLDIADSDLSENSDPGIIHVTEWKHPELPVYLTVTRKSEEILILLHQTLDADGQTNPDAAKQFIAIQKQLEKNFKPQ